MSSKSTSQAAGVRRSRVRVALGGLLLTTAATALPVLTAPPAAAAVPGLVVVDSGVVVATSDTAQSEEVTCPAGTVLINASGYITGGGGSVGMDDIYPDAATNTVTVTGKETDPYSGTWRITAVAHCADPLPGLDWVSETSAWTPDNKSITASCDPGQALVGTGATIEGGYGEVLLSAITPENGSATAPADGVTATGTEETQYFAGWRVTAFAACADPLPGQWVNDQATASNTTTPKSVDATCVGQVSTGTGAAITGAGRADAVIDDVYGNDNAVGVVDQTVGYAYEEDSGAAAWRLRVWSLCADI